MWFVYCFRWVATSDTTKPVNKSPAWNIPSPQSPPTSQPPAASTTPATHPNTSSKTQRHAQQQSYNGTQQQSITTADHNERGQSYVPYRTVQQQDGQSASVMRSPVSGQQQQQNQRQQNQRQRTTSTAAVNLQDIMSQEAEEMEALQRYANKPLSSVQV